MPDRHDRKVAGRVRSVLGPRVQRLARPAGAEGGTRRALLRSAAELGTAVRTRGVPTARAAVSATAARGLDGMAGVVARIPAPIEDLDALEHRAGQVRRGASATLTTIQGLLVTSTAATDGVAGPPALAVDAALAQVASVVTGLAEWYLVGSYAAVLMRRAGVDPEGRQLRPIVNGALLSDETGVRAAEGRLVARWIGRGVAEALPFLSAYPTKRVRRAGERLEARLVLPAPD